MALDSKFPDLANPNRFKPIQDLHQWSPDCGVSADDCFSLDNEPRLITDPRYLWQTFNPHNDTSSSYARTHGVIVTGFGSDASCPVFWCDPFLLLPLSSHLEEEFPLPEEAGKLTDKVLGASGSFVFLPLRDDMPPSLQGQVNQVLDENKGVKVRLPAGSYRVFYEQFQAPENAPERFYRNLVAQRQ